MLVQHQQPVPLQPPSPAVSPAPECHYNAHISSPAAVQILSDAVKTRKSPPTEPNAIQPSFRFRRATIKDAAAIAHLGSTVFSTTFGFSIPTKDLNAYLDEAYTVEAIERDIRDPKKHLIVACSRTVSRSDASETSSSSLVSDASTDKDEESDAEDGDRPEEEIIGFTQLTEDTTEPCLSHLRSTVELQRLYVATSHHGYGVGSLLARKIDQVARDLGYRCIWLGVWEGNFKAQRVYERLGFVKVGDHEFKMGKCIQMDWIMSKEL